MTGEESVPEPYLSLWQVAVLIGVTCFLAALSTVVLVRLPSYAMGLLVTPGLLLSFRFCTTVALGAIFYQYGASTSSVREEP